MNPLKYWSPESFEISSFRWGIVERRNKTYKWSGSDQTGLCSYSYNELGFRADSIYKEGFKVMSIGCSNTEGVGVNIEETWPAQFCDLIGNAVNINLSVGGRSNDFIARVLLTYYDFFKPDLVLIMYTESHRKEFFTKDGNIEPFHHIPWGYFSETEEGKEEHNALLTILNKENNYQNWLKNHFLITYFLETKKANWLWDGWFATDRYTDERRYNGDFYPHIDFGVDGKHPGPNTHQKYAKNIYKYIQTNFPQYLKV
jgi:hypothetical protein